MFSKVQRKKAYVENEKGYFSYFEMEGADKTEPLIFFHATGLNCETYLDLLEKIYFLLDSKKTIIGFDQRGHGKKQSHHPLYNCGKQISKILNYKCRGIEKEESRNGKTFFNSSFVCETGKVSIKNTLIKNRKTERVGNNFVTFTEMSLFYT